MAARKQKSSGTTIKTSPHSKFALRADSGLSLGNVFPLAPSRTVIGRSVEAEIPVDDTQVSRSHAALDIQSGRPVVVDLGSTNGTYVNGVRVKNVKRILVGDKIRIGSAVFVLELFDDAKAKLKKTWRSTTQVAVRSEVITPALPPMVSAKEPSEKKIVPKVEATGIEWQKFLDKSFWKSNKRELEPWALGAICIGLLLIALSL